VRHALDLLLGTVDGSRDRTGELLEHVGEMELLGGSLTRSRLVLGVGLDAAIRVETADHAVGFLEDATAFLDQRADFLYQLLFVKLLLGSSLGLVNFL
jgi:hypothetical protein